MQSTNQKLRERDTMNKDVIATPFRQFSTGDAGNRNNEEAGSMGILQLSIRTDKE